MNKTEMMKKYEAEAGKQSAIVKFMAGGQALESKDFPKIGPYDYSTDYIAWLESKAEAYDRLSTWHDDLPKNDGRYICVIGDGGYPIIFAKKFENGRWVLGEKEKIKWAYLPDGWEEVWEVAE